MKAPVYLYIAVPAPQYPKLKVMLLAFFVWFMHTRLWDAVTSAFLAIIAPAPVRVADWTELKPGQAFFVWLTKAGVEDGVHLVQLDGFETAPAADPAGQYLFRGIEALPPQAEFWKWDNGRYAPAESGAGWLKLP